jgi:hypothetical protein
VTCDRCADLCVRYAIRHPRELRKAIQIAAENIADKTLVEVLPDSPWVSVSNSRKAQHGTTTSSTIFAACIARKGSGCTQKRTTAVADTWNRKTQNRYATTSPTSHMLPIATVRHS